MQYAADISRPLGAVLARSGCDFHVWAPEAQSVSIHVVHPAEQLIPMTRNERGYWRGHAPGLGAGARYFYQLDGEKDRPDPASRFQPEGVHGPSEVVDASFPWTDAGWCGIPLQTYIFYELHVGAFTEGGTFDAAIQRLPDLVDLGVTAIEIMPVAQFPGDRNWGYDGVLPFAVQSSYGGPEALKRLVDACHAAGLAVVLDVVYNHLGPEGNYFNDFGPYFTDRYRSPWGSAMNFDGPGSDEVRRYFIENAVYWLREFHVDALRLDAVHAMLDFSAGTFLEEMATVVERENVELNRQTFLIGESDLNDSRVVRTRPEHGFGLDAQWADDLHHALHVLLTGEGQGYYKDFARGEGAGSPLRNVAAALEHGVIYQGQYAPSRGRRHGNSFTGVPAHRLVVCTQNHDQVGNRVLGDRLPALVSPKQLRLAAAVMLLSPYLPLLFMGEEHGETNPFLFFVSHTDADLLEAVRQGRKEEFSEFMAQGEAPDPGSEETFRRSRPDWRRAREGWHAELRALYKELIGLRKCIPALRYLSKERLEVQVFEDAQVLVMHRWFGESHVAAAFNFGAGSASVSASLPRGVWDPLLGTAEPMQVAGEAAAKLSVPGEDFVLYEREVAR